jgi:hypothetical protein
MRIWASSAVLLVVCFAAVRAAQVPPVVAWTGGEWYDGTGFVRLDMYSLGDRLTRQRPSHVDRTVDLTDLFVVPPFVEAHNHNIPGRDEMPQTYLRQGIYAVMIQGNVPDARQQSGSRINRPDTIDVAFANGLFTAPHGHPTALVKRNVANGGMTVGDLDGGFLQPVAIPADVERAFQRARAQRPDFIKIVLVYSEDRETDVPRPSDSDRHGLDPALVSLIVKDAHAAGLRVSAHVESARDFEVAIDSGADVIAHLPGFWPDENRITAKGLDQYRISDTAARRAAARRVAVITTLGESIRLAASGKISESVGKPLLQLHRDNVALLKRHGAVVVVGSDQFRATSLGEALALHEARIMSDADLLRALTIDAMRTVFPQRVIAPAENAAADFVALPADPLVDFSAIERPRLRVKSGRELQ